jgi:hypothetical protein
MTSLILTLLPAAVTFTIATWPTKPNTSHHSTPCQG